MSALPSSLHSATLALICSLTSVLISPVSPAKNSHWNQWTLFTGKLLDNYTHQWPPLASSLPPPPYEAEGGEIWVFCTWHQEIEIFRLVVIVVTLYFFFCINPLTPKFSTDHIQGEVNRNLQEKKHTIVNNNIIWKKKMQWHWGWLLHHVFINFPNKFFQISLPSLQNWNNPIKPNDSIALYLQHILFAWSIVVLIFTYVIFIINFIILKYSHH